MSDFSLRTKDAGLSSRSMSNFKNYLLILTAFIVARPSLAHNPAGEGDPTQKVIEYGRLLEKISALDIVTDATIQERPAVPQVKMLGKNYYINSNFYQLTEQIAQLYIEEIRGVCPECELPSKERINEEVKDLVAKGWFKTMGEAAVRTVAIRYGTEFIYLGARYGTMAGALKVAGELVEDALLVVFKMPGAHFLCEVITLAIARYSGALLTTYRTHQNAKGFGRGGVTQLARLTATSWLAKRALKKVSLEVGPIEIHPELLEVEPPSTEGREWIAHELTEEKKLERFLFGLSKKAESIYQKIDHLRAEKLKLNPRKQKRIDRRIKTLEAKLSRFAKTKRKIFEARRIGASLWLIKRRGRMSLANNEIEIHEQFRGTKAWMVPLTSSITNASFVLKDGPSRESFLEKIERGRRSEPGSEIDNFLTAEARLAQPEILQKLFKDIDYLFETKLPRRERYLQLLMIEAYLGEVVPRIIRDFMSTLSVELIESDNSMAQVRRIVKLQWSAGQLTYFADAYLDYLRSATITRGKNKLVFEADLAKDYFVQLLKSQEIVSTLRGQSAAEKQMEIQARLSENLKQLRSRQFWLEKRATHSLLPIKELLMKATGLGKWTNLVRRRPVCSKLYR